MDALLYFLHGVGVAIALLGTGSGVAILTGWWRP